MKDHRSIQSADVSQNKSLMVVPGNRIFWSQRHMTNLHNFGHQQSFNDMINSLSYESGGRTHYVHFGQPKGALESPMLNGLLGKRAKIYNPVPIRMPMVSFCQPRYERWIYLVSVDHIFF